jgi:hypothetical protein
LRSSFAAIRRVPADGRTARGSLETRRKGVDQVHEEGIGARRRRRGPAGRLRDEVTEQCTEQVVRNASRVAPLDPSGRHLVAERARERARQRDRE